MSDLKKILATVKKYLPNADTARISAAYHFSEAAHSDQLRFSGEPYFVHPVSATLHLLTLQPDEDTIIACLLHDVIEDTETDVAIIEKKFGETVASLCLDMEKLGTLQFRGEERQIENLRKMFVAMARDLRVIFIKLADRLHNMETLEHVRPDKQKRIARETLEVYAPIASRLGIYEFKSRLEDLAFQYLEPEEYARLAKSVGKTTAANRQKFIEAAKIELKNILKKGGIKAEITGRTKHLYSIWRKLKLKNYTSVEAIYDLFALRVITESTADCYAALGVIHNRYTPLSQRFKDFIAVPKSNGYRSLHTTVIGLLRSQPTEIQIRTREMHAQAEYGAAAHWQYSDQKKSVTVEADKLKWVRGLVELHEQMKDNSEFVDSLTSDALENRIFVLTPKGDVLDLPAGATPIDFAYAIHTEVGHRCTGAKVNGKITPLDRVLENGQMVEILTRRDAKPNRFWLSFAKTSSAGTKIRTYFGMLGRTENIAAGKDLLNKRLARLGKSKLDNSYSILRNYKNRKLSKTEREQLLERVGNGSVAANAVVHDLFKLSDLALPKTHKKPVATITAPLSKNNAIVIEGVSGIATTLAKCCAPKISDQILAVVGRKGAIIHRTDCKQIARSRDDSKLAAHFAAAVLPLVKIAVGGRNRVGFLRDIANVIAELEINIADLSLKKSDRHEILHELTLEVGDHDQLNAVLEKLEQIEGASKVTRI